MEKLSLELPAMYGDQHVTEVRRVVGQLPGVTDIYASSSQQRLVVSFDPAQLSRDAIVAALTGAGYAPGRAFAPVGVETLGMVERGMHHVAAGAEAEATAHLRYEPPPSFGVCPGLEPRAMGGEHPGDRR